MRSPIPANCSLLQRPIDAADIAQEAAAGLSRTPKTLPCKLFYDAAGCQLFAAICETPEYDLRRCEAEIFRRHGVEIAQAIRAGQVTGPTTIIEPGAGSCDKVAWLLGHLTADAAPSAYVPLDIAAEQLHACAARLAARFPRVSVQAVAMDFVRDIEHIERLLPPGGQRTVYYPGSSIGNFSPPEAIELLRRFAGLAGVGGVLLIGFDAKKRAARLHAAYNDAAGLTARFNLNLLVRLNRECDAGFDLDAFEHYAIYRPDQGRIEMHLLCHRNHRVHLAAQFFDIAEGETLHTENSYKYLPEEFDMMAAQARWRIVDGWHDGQRDFWLRCYRTNA